MIFIFLMQLYVFPDLSFTVSITLYIPLSLKVIIPPLFVNVPVAYSLYFSAFPLSFDIVHSTVYPSPENDIFMSEPVYPYADISKSAFGMSFIIISSEYINTRPVSSVTLAIRV